MVFDVLLQRAAFGQADEGLVDHVGRWRRRAGQRMAARHDQRERVGTEHEGLQAGEIGRVGYHADIAQVVAHRVDDLVADPLLQLHRDQRVLREEAAEGLRQMLAQRGGIAQQADMALQPATVAAQLALQAFYLMQHRAGMLGQRVAGGGRAHATPLAQQQRGAERVLHGAHALAGRCQRHVRRLCPARDGARLEDVEEKPQVGQVETHAATLARPASGPA